MKSPEGTRRIGPPFPIEFNTWSQKSISKILLYGEEEGGREETAASHAPGREGQAFLGAWATESESAERERVICCDIPKKNQPN